MHKNTTKCNKTQSKWCINKHGASKIIDTFETYQSQSQSKRRNRVSHCDKGESFPFRGRMADEQGSCKPWCSNTSKLDEGSLDGVPVRLAPTEKEIVVGKSEIRRRHESATVASRML
jgi:hypothetical protein